MKIASQVFTIFGSTGDLTYRKLIPALYHLEHRNLLAADFEIRCVGRRPYTQAEYQSILEPWLEKQSRFRLDENTKLRFFNKIHYIQLEFTDLSAYQHLKAYPVGQNNLYYFAVAPEFFVTIAQHLNDSGYFKQGQHEVVLEKPFGDSLKHTQKVYRELSQILSAESIYPIDHYLGKEMIQNILALRFTNRVFSSVWNSDNIAAIQITVAEMVGVETRGNYYELAGALKDMVQNHLLQILSYVVMDEPKDLCADALSSQQIKSLKSIQLDELILGQYGESNKGNAYTQEKLVNKHSKVETYAALKVHFEEGLLKKVPVYMRTGKRLNHRATYIKVLFKPSQSSLYDFNSHEVLTFKVQPDEGVSFSFNAKKPGTLQTIENVKMDYCQSCILENRMNTPEAYERLLDDAFKKDKTLYTPWELVEIGWEFGEKIQKRIKDHKLELIIYPSGSSGPNAAQDLLMKDGFVWLDENEYSY